MAADRSKFVFVLPGLIVLVAIILFPLLFTIRVSFSNWDVARPGVDWVGATNYLRLAHDTRFWDSFGRLALMAVGSVLLQYLLGFGLALLVWREVRARR
ncbi:MAG TPA: sugar ABC transporter permease, partial [Burkholderiales bacterium]|nr:sugar ABC transporter permease [Burkholderiales bacterium]